MPGVDPASLQERLASQSQGEARHQASAGFSLLMWRGRKQDTVWTLDLESPVVCPLVYLLHTFLNSVCFH